MLCNLASASLLLAAASTSVVNAYSTNIQRRLVSSSEYQPALQRRHSQLAGRAATGTEEIKDVTNTLYVANLTVGGDPFTVILDTGSSDLWVAGQPKSNDTGVSATVQYAIGTASGNVHTAPVTFSDFDIPSQAYIQVVNASSFGSITPLGINGLAGLGPSTPSNVLNAVGSPRGDTLLDNIFKQNKTSSNFITFLLGRDGDNGDSSANVQGQFTISEVIQGYENITSQPKLEVNELTGPDASNQHWTTVMDAIIGPDGQKINVETIVKGTPKGKLAAVIDSGFTLPQVPRVVSDAIYGRVNGAQFDKSSQTWLIPCDQELNISMVFGGVTFPVNPLDTVSSDLDATFADGSPACAGAFQPISTAFSLDGVFDTIMGDGFLRNAYALLNLGDFVNETSNARGQPFIQMLPTTQMSLAHAQFVKERLNGTDITGESQFALKAHGQSSPVSPGERIQHLEGFATRNIGAIVGAVVGGVALLVIIGLGLCCFRRFKRKRAAKAMQSDSGILPLTQPAQHYRQVSDPRSAPPGGSYPYQQGGYNQSSYRV